MKAEYARRRCLNRNIEERGSGHSGVQESGQRGGGGDLIKCGVDDH